MLKTMTIAEIVDENNIPIFDFDYPIDRKYKDSFESMFLDKFYDYEINYLTVGMFKRKLKSKLTLALPYYNQLLNSQLLKIDPMGAMNIKEDYTRLFHSDITQNAERDSVSEIKQREREEKRADSNTRDIKNAVGTNAVNENDVEETDSVVDTVGEKNTDVTGNDKTAKTTDESGSKDTDGKVTETHSKNTSGTTSDNDNLTGTSSETDHTSKTINTGEITVGTVSGNETNSGTEYGGTVTSVEGTVKDDGNTETSTGMLETGTIVDDGEVESSTKTHSTGSKNGTSNESRNSAGTVNKYFSDTPQVNFVIGNSNPSTGQPISFYATTLNKDDSTEQMQDNITNTETTVGDVNVDSEGTSKNTRTIDTQKDGQDMTVSLMIKTTEMLTDAETTKTTQNEKITSENQNKDVQTDTQTEETSTKSGNTTGSKSSIGNSSGTESGNKLTLSEENQITSDSKIEDTTFDTLRNTQETETENETGNTHKTTTKSIVGNTHDDIIDTGTALSVLTGGTNVDTTNDLKTTDSTDSAMDTQAMYVKTLSGYKDINQSKRLIEYRQTFIRVWEQLFDELKILFLGVYDV
jgi:hypothetical protein